MRLPKMTCPLLDLERGIREKKSGSALAAEGIHSVLIFMEPCSMYKFAPCAHLSKGYLGHLDESNQLLAE